MRDRVGPWIRQLRQRRGWTQRQLAERLGTDPVTVSRWERGTVAPRPSARVRLRALARSPMDGALENLVGLLGKRRTLAVLRRAALLARPPRRVPFAAEPTVRLREVERSLAEQMELRRRIRMGS